MNPLHLPVLAIHLLLLNELKLLKQGRHHNGLDIPLRSFRPLLQVLFHLRNPRPRLQAPLLAGILLVMHHGNPLTFPASLVRPITPGQNPKHGVLAPQPSLLHLPFPVPQPLSFSINSCLAMTPTPVCRNIFILPPSNHPSFCLIPWHSKQRRPRTPTSLIQGRPCLAPLQNNTGKQWTKRLTVWKTNKLGTTLIVVKSLKVFE